MRKLPPDRLSRDAMAAQAAGLSCGKYKVLHPFTGEQEPEELAPENRRVLNCAFCGKPFVHDSRHANRRYCDDECKQAAWTSRSNARKQELLSARRCALCGKPIECTNNRLYCSMTCRSEAGRIRYRNKRRLVAAKRENA